MCSPDYTAAPHRQVLEALQTDDDMLLILTDSMAAKLTTINLAKGAAPRSQIEQDIKMALRRRESLTLDTGISWVRAHIGIRGNELADQHATYHSWLGEVSGAPRTVTEGGIRRVAKEARKDERSVAGYGLGGRTQWGRRALSAYTWFRTGKGPQRQIKTMAPQDRESRRPALPMRSRSTVRRAHSLALHPSPARARTQPADYGNERRGMGGPRRQSLGPQRRCRRTGRNRRPTGGWH